MALGTSDQWTNGFSGTLGALQTADTSPCASLDGRYGVPRAERAFRRARAVPGGNPRSKTNSHKARAQPRLVHNRYLHAKHGAPRDAHLERHRPNNAYVGRAD
jgi:hypothetical protein